MGFLDDIKGKAASLRDTARDLVKEHDDKIEGAIDKAADLADDKTGGKHTDRIDKAQAKAKDAVDKIARKP